MTEEESRAEGQKEEERVRAGGLLGMEDSWRRKRGHTMHVRTLGLVCACCGVNSLTNKAAFSLWEAVFALRCARVTQPLGSSFARDISPTCEGEGPILQWT